MNEINSKHILKRRRRFYYATIGIPIYVTASYAMSKLTDNWLFPKTTFLLLILPIIEFVKLTVFYQKNQRILKKVFAVIILIFFFIIVFHSFKINVFGFQF